MRWSLQNSVGLAGTNGRRVLFLTSNYPRWIDDTTTPFVHDLAVGLVEEGWGVTVLAPHDPGAARHEVMDGVAVYRFRYAVPDRAQTVCYRGGALINIRGSGLNKAKVPGLVMSEWIATARLLARGADLLHSHWILPQGFVGSTTPHRRVPRVLSVHGGDVFGLRGRVVDRFSRYALRHSDQVTVNSSATEQAVRLISGNRAMVKRVPMGVDLSRKPRRRVVHDIRQQFRSGDGPLLVFLGRVVEEKGVEDVVRAISLLALDMPDVSAVVAGTGQYFDRARRLASDLNITGRIHFPGWVDPLQVPSWFAAADVVLAPSRVGPDGWMEGQGLSIIEAMSVGTPVVSTRTGGIPDTITDEDTGLLVPPADPSALVTAVKRLVSQPALAAKIGERASQAVHARFDRSIAANRFTSIYEHLLAASRTSV
jgi:glycosyltransferase involved in cell wall biosynthesis